MDKAIWNVLRNSRSNDVYQTHVSLFEPTGRFTLDRKKVEEFWNVYCDKLSKNPTTFVCGVAEKPQHYLPVLVDVDIARTKKPDESSAVKLHNENHIIELIKVYQQVLTEIVDDITDRDLVCIVLTKDPYLADRNDGNSWVKHGFHLHFPWIWLSRIDQETHLIPRVKTAVGSKRIFADIGFSDSASLLDTGYCGTPWLLYGSSKSIDKKPYLFSYCINHSQEKISLGEALTEYNIFDVAENEIDIRGKELYYLPRILSIAPYGREISDLKSGLPSPLLKANNRKTRRHFVSSEDNTEFLNNMSRYKKLVNMLSDHRAEDRNEWMTIGWTLYNIGNGCEEAREMWLEFSKRCPSKYDETACILAWDRMVKMDKGEGSLRHFASVDNPEEYEKFRSENVREYVTQSLNGSHYDIAQALYEMYGTEFVCSSLKHQTWYSYYNHRWNEMEQGVFLRKKISTEILNQYTTLMHDIVEKLAKCDDVGEKAMYDARLKSLSKIMSSLKNSSFKKNIMNEAAELFYDPNFSKKLDKNPYLIGFKNGVYDMNMHRKRDGSPDDYISLQMAVDYKVFTSDTPEVIQVHEFLEKVFPDISVRNYFMDTASDIFVGGNHHKLVQVWTGEGDNAKSVTQTLFEKMLGQYAVKLPTSLIVGKRTQASAACPELVRAGGGVRFAVLQEPDQKDVINIGILKELSGNDTFFARTLFKEGGEITPMFKLVLICNEPPQLPYGDRAVWNRIRVVPFESTFADENSSNPPPETFEEQLREKRFPKDKSFTDKIPGMIEAFAYILLEHRKKILDKKRIDPPKVRSATEQYRKRNDIYRQFVEETIVNDDDSSVSLSELYTSFKSWFKEALPNHVIPVKNDVSTYFTKAWGSPEPGVKWPGKRLRTLKDDMKEGNAFVVDIPEGIPVNCAENFVPL